MANLIQPLYSPDGNNQLSAAKLRQMTDEDLMRHLYEHYKPDLISPEFFYSALVNWFPSYREFNNEKKAMEQARAMHFDNNVVVLGIRRSRGFDPATSYKVLDKSGKIISFKDFSPEKAAQIEAVEQATHGVFLFFKGTLEPTPINNLLRRLHSRK